LAVASEESTAFERLAKSAPSPDDRVLSALEAEFGAEPPARAWSRRSRLCLSLALLALALIVTSWRTLGSTAASLVLLALGCSLALAVFFLAAAVPGRIRWHHRQRQLLVVSILLLTCAHVAWTSSGFEPLLALAEGDPWSRVLACGLHALVSAGLCLVALLSPWRRVEAFSPTLLGALFGALAGFSGMLSVDAGCVSTEGFHLLLGHALAVVVFGLVGAALGRRWLAP
jgi:hypothetical protein